MQSVRLADRSLTLVTVNDDNRYLLNRFYKRNGYKGKADDADQAFYLSHKEQIMAALRLTPKENYKLLRGLWVEKNSRGQSYGSELLTLLNIELLNKPCYCFPYSNQQGFYQHNHFIDASDSAPTALQQQWRGYVKRGEDLLLMKYQR